MEQDGCSFHYDYPPPHENLGPGCQFEDETEFFDCDGKRYCRFHLPMADDDDQRTEKSSWLVEEAPGPELADFHEALDAHIEASVEAERLVNFSGVVFPGNTDFTEHAFPPVLWYLALFHGHATFAGVKFKGYADFRDAEFKGDASFSDAEFEGHASFRDAEFKGTAYFTDAEFEGYAYFTDAEFEGDASFSGAEFKGPADFSDAEIEGHASFRDAEFKGTAYFTGAEFKGYASFSDAEFESHADFIDAEFKGTASFRDAEFKGTASFRDAEFKGPASLTNAKFSTLTNFQGSLFMHPPLFHNAPLHQDTRFNPGDGIARQFTNIVDDTAEQAYRTLKLHMSANQAHREGQFFFKLEMKARARHERRWWRGLYVAYDFFSDYGHSIARPLAWWFVLLLFMTGVQAAASSKFAAAGHFSALTLSDWMAASMAAASNALPIGGFARQGLAQAVEDLYRMDIPTWLPILGTAHTLLSGILLFLAVLALRNLFRMK